MKNLRKSFVVYMATNTINGKRYVGATSRGLSVRRSKHFGDAKGKRPGCRVFNAAIRKYGADAFTWKVLATLSSHDEMMIEEVRVIRKMAPEYNITSGGRGMIGIQRTPEWTEKIASALRGRKLKPEQIEAMRHMDKSFQFKSIVCLNDARFFPSIKAASEFYGISDNSIGEVLNGRQFKCGKDNLSFVFSGMPIDRGQCVEMLADVMRRRFESASKRKSRPVVCLTTGVEYKNAVSAAAANGISPSRVMQLCQNGGATNSGISFRYADGPAIMKLERNEPEREYQQLSKVAA